MTTGTLSMPVTKSVLVVGFMLLALVAGLAIGGVGDGESHSGTVVAKGILRGMTEDADKAYFIVDEEGYTEYTVHRVKTLEEYRATDIDDNVQWEDRRVINVVLGMFAFIAIIMIAVPALFLADDW